MNKEELKTRLIIAKGELSCEIDYEYGCFDEIASRILLLCIGCEELRDKSSDDVLVQLDKSVAWNDNNLYIDGFYLSTTTTSVNFTASDIEDEEDLYAFSIWEVDRDVILKVIDELINMCL